MPKIFIGSIKKNSATFKLQERLQEVGFVKRASILHPSDNVISKGFAIVDIEFKNISIESFLNSKIHYEGVNLYLAKYLEGDDIKKRNQDLSKKKVFVSGIPESCTNEILLKIFSHYGGIETAYINRKRHIKKTIATEDAAAGDQKSQEAKFFFGFVTFLEEDSAAICLEEGVAHLGYDFEVNRFTPKPLTDFKQKQTKDKIKQETKQKKLKKKRKRNKKKKKKSASDPEKRSAPLQKHPYVRRHTSGRANKESPLLSPEVLHQQHQRQRKLNWHQKLKNYSQYLEKACMRHHPLDDILEISKNHDDDNLRFNHSRFTNQKLKIRRNKRRANLSSSNPASYRFTAKHFLTSMQEEQHPPRETFGYSRPTCNSFTEEEGYIHF